MSNDAALSLAGDILSDSQPYVFEMLEGCYEDLQDRLMQVGVNTYYKYWTVLGLGAVTSADPTTQVKLQYTGYYDGTNNNANPTLPSDLLEPLEIWERQTGSTFAWKPMKVASDSISTRPQIKTFNIWDWETDVLYLPGATQSNDLKIKGLLYAPVLTGPTSPVLVARCTNALAALMIEAAADMRGGAGAEIFGPKAQKYIDQIINRTVQKDQRAVFVRQPFRGRRRRGR